MLGFKRKEGGRLRREFFYLVDPKLRALLLDLANLCHHFWHRDLVVTCLFRDEAENEAIGGNPNSAHLSGRAADLRVNWIGGDDGYTDKEIDTLIEYVKGVWGNGYHIICHGEGANRHIHLNVNLAFGSGAGTKFSDLIAMIPNDKPTTSKPDT